jgi:hypothetical protein
MSVADLRGAGLAGQLPCERRVGPPSATNGARKCRPIPPPHLHAVELRSRQASFINTSTSRHDGSS